jgi:8-amino-7-oxononanoate synthase
MATLGKAAGAFGAVVATSSSVSAWLKNRARSFVFATGMPASNAAAAREGLRLLSAGEALRERLWRNVEMVADGLRELGHEATSRSPIFSLVLGAPERALAAAAQLRERGLLVKAIRPPTVPAGTSRLRITVSAAHSDDDIARLLVGLRGLEGAR